MLENPSKLYSYGIEDGDPNYMLHAVKALAFDSRNNLYILDSGNSRVVVVDSSGKYITQFGRKGSGPGEFQAPSSIGVGPDGTVIVDDGMRRTFIRFDSAGQLLSEHRGPDWYRHVTPITIVSPGVVLAEAWLTPEGRASVVRINMRDGADSILFRLARVPADHPKYAPIPQMIVLPNGNVAIRQDHTYSITIFDEWGNAVDTVDRPLAPRPVTAALRHATEERQKVLLAKSKGSGRAGIHVVAEPENIPYAAYLPHISDLAADGLGRIWVQRYADDGEMRGPIDILTQNGDYLGTLPPQDLPRAWSPSGRVAWVVPDTNGTERISVAQLPANWQ